ncbi:MAG: oligosaccharide repeat unit polymerase [Clostridia bacterium]|nr:oligosaccharide repeat unit polymerase [Clostridia bacterium]
MALVIITILLPLVFLIVDFYKERKIYSPAVLFNAIFFVTLLLYSFKWSHIQQDLSTTTLWCLFLCEIGFNIPIVISYFIKKKDNKKTDEPIIINESADKTIKTMNNEDGIFTLNKKLEFGIFIFVFVVFVFEVIYCKGFPIIWKLFEDEKVYINFVVPKVTVWFNAIVVVMGAYSIVNPTLFPGLFYKGFYLLIPLLMVSRQMIIAMVFEALIIYLITKKNKSKEFYLYCVIGVMLVLLGFSAFGNVRTGESDFLLVAQFKDFCKYIPTVFKWIYSYMCFSISNLNNLISIAEPGITKGLSTWNELVPSMLDVDSTHLFNEEFLVSLNFNVSTFAPSLYLDFGIFGVGAFCLIIGACSQFLFKKMKNNFILNFIYAIAAYSIVFIFFVNMFFNFQVICQVVFSILIFVVLNNFIEKKSKKVKNSQGGKI